MSGEQRDDTCANLLVYGCDGFSGPTGLLFRSDTHTGEPINSSETPSNNGLNETEGARA
jgi:hypothetical protein